jgi:hypothetical protein
VIRRAVAAAAVGLILLATGATSAMASPGATVRPQIKLFGGAPLLPGKGAHDTITVPAAPVAIRPYWQIADLQQVCDGAKCAAGTPSLAQQLRITATASSGVSWSGSLARLERRVALPGGMLAAGHGRTYRLTLSLPASTGNRYQGVAVSAIFIWDGKVSATLGITPPPAGTGVLGEHTGRGGHHGGSQQGGSGSNEGGSLPFTGFDAIRLLAMAFGLLGLGSTLVVVGRRRRLINANHADIHGFPRSDG